MTRGVNLSNQYMRIRVDAQHNALNLLVNLLVENKALSKENVQKAVSLTLINIADMKDKDDFYNTHVAGTFSDLFRLDSDQPTPPTDPRRKFRVIDGDLA